MLVCSAGSDANERDGGSSASDAAKSRPVEGLHRVFQSGTLYLSLDHMENTVWEPQWLGRDASSSPMVCAIRVALSLWEYFKCFHSRMRVFTIDLHAKTHRVSILIQKALTFF